MIKVCQLQESSHKGYNTHKEERQRLLTSYRRFFYFNMQKHIQDFLYRTVVSHQSCDFFLSTLQCLTESCFPPLKNVLFSVISYPTVFCCFFTFPSQPQPFSGSGQQQVSSVCDRHGGCRPSFGVVSLRGMLCVRGGQGVSGGGPWDAKPPKSEPQITAACPALVEVFCQSTQVCPATAHTNTHTHVLQSFHVPLSVVTSCWRAVVVSRTLTCSYMLSFSPHCLLKRHHVGVIEWKNLFIFSTKDEK